MNQPFHPQDTRPFPPASRGAAPVPVPVHVNTPYGGQQDNRTYLTPTPAPSPAPARPQSATFFGGLPMWALVAALVAGAAAALMVLPAWAPVLGNSIAEAEPKVYWYLSRSSAMVAFGLLWFSMASGLIISNKLARVWPGVAGAFDLHQYTSLLALGFGLFHGLILIGNTYIHYDLVQVFLPFASPDYRPLWVGLGQIGFYLSLLATGTFYLRRFLGKRGWRVVHFVTYAAFVLSLLHGLFSGTDSTNIVIRWFYWGCGVSLLALTIYRVLDARMSAPQKAAPHAQP